MERVQVQEVCDIRTCGIILLVCASGAMKCSIILTKLFIKEGYLLGA